MQTDSDGQEVLDPRTGSNRLRVIEAETLADVYRIFGRYFRFTSTLGLSTADGRPISMDSPAGDTLARLVADGPGKNADRIIEILKPACLRFDAAAIRSQLEALDDPYDRAQQFDRDNTPNLEEIVLAADGRFELHPLPFSDDEAFAVAKVRLAEALDRVRRALAAERNNELTALLPSVELVERELARSGDAPYLIYHAVMRAVRRIAIQREEQELSADHPAVEQFNRDLSAIGPDLLGKVRQVRKALTARIAFHLSEFSEAEQEDLRKLGADLKGISVPRLGEQMVEDAETATNPFEKDAEARKGAVYQFSSRLFRMMQRNRSRVDTLSVAAGAGGIITSLIAMFV